jgi:hypothetical protein
MSKFKVGDRVKYVSDKYGDIDSNPKWGGICGNVIGTIMRVTPYRVGLCEYFIEWDNGTENSAYTDDDLEFAKKEKKEKILYSGGF